MKSFGILQELWKCDRDRKWANAVGKMMIIDLLNTGLPEAFNLWIIQYLWSTMEWGVPVYKKLLTDEFYTFELKTSAHQNAL